MESLTSIYGRKVAKLLDRLLDSPLEISWDSLPREAIPLKEVILEGKAYQPARTEKTGERGAVRHFEADTFSAAPQLLASLWREGKLMTALPYCDLGQTAEDERAFWPWAPPEGLTREPGDDVLVRVELLKNVSVIPGLKPAVRLGEIFALPFGHVRALGFNLARNAYCGPLLLIFDL